MRPPIHANYAAGEMNYNQHFDRSVVQPFIDSIPSIIKDLTKHFLKLVKEQVEAESKLRGISSKWKPPNIKPRNLHVEFPQTSRQRVTTYLKVSATHPSSHWIGVFHGMRLLKDSGAIVDVAAKDFQ